MITTDNAETLRLAEQRIAALEARCAKLLDKLKAAEIEAYNTKAERDRWKAATEAFWRGSELLGIGPLQAAAIYGPDFDLDGETNAAFIEARRLTAIARGEKP